MTRTRLTALALTATTLAASGCGGSSAKSLTSAELIQKADAVCKRVNARLTLANGEVKSRQDIGRLAPQLAAFQQSAVAELKKLTPPASLANDWKQIVAGAQTLAVNTAKLGEYARSNNMSGARQLVSSSKSVQQQMLATAKRDGFKDCSQEA